MYFAQWTLSTKPWGNGLRTVLLAGQVGWIHRLAAGFGGILGTLGTWELLLRPFVFSNLPPMGLLAVPFLILGIICLCLALFGLAYAVLAARHWIAVDRADATLTSALDLSIPASVLWKTPLRNITRLWTERSDFHETRETWELKIQLRGKRHPTQMHAFDSEGEARQALQQWNKAIAEVTGSGIPQ